MCVCRQVPNVRFNVPAGRASRNRSCSSSRFAVRLHVFRGLTFMCRAFAFTSCFSLLVFGRRSPSKRPLPCNGCTPKGSKPLRQSCKNEIHHSLSDRGAFLSVAAWCQKCLAGCIPQTAKTTLNQVAHIYIYIYIYIYAGPKESCNLAGQSCSPAGGSCSPAGVSCSLARGVLLSPS